MSENEISYPFAYGDLLAQPITYFYSAYAGKPFLSAWRGQRDSVLRRAPAPSPAPEATLAILTHADTVETASLLEFVFHALSQKTSLDSEAANWLARLVHKFEVFKRVHDAYRSGFRAVNRNDHKTLNHYLRLAEVFDLAWNRMGHMVYLNALLKIMDTLCSVYDQLSREEQARLATLIHAERQYIDDVATAQGLSF